ncbi:hypothetical protein ACYZTX_29250 [Pseudomonas sp. MDT1-17]
MRNQEVPRRDKNNAGTLERARECIASVINAESLVFWREDALIAQGWISALYIEGLLDVVGYEQLDAELEVAMAAGEGRLARRVRTLGHE